VEWWGLTISSLQARKAASRPMLFWEPWNTSASTGECILPLSFLSGLSRPSRPAPGHHLHVKDCGHPFQFVGVEGPGIKLSADRRELGLTISQFRRGRKSDHLSSTQWHDRLSAKCIAGWSAPAVTNSE